MYYIFPHQPPRPWFPFWASMIRRTSSASHQKWDNFAIVNFVWVKLNSLISTFVFLIYDILLSIALHVYIDILYIVYIYTILYYIISYDIIIFIFILMYCLYTYIYIISYSISSTKFEHRVPPNPMVSNNVSLNSHIKFGYTAYQMCPHGFYHFADISIFDNLQDIWRDRMENPWKRHECGQIPISIIWLCLKIGYIPNEIAI